MVNRDPTISSFEYCDFPRALTFRSKLGAPEHSADCFVELSESILPRLPKPCPFVQPSFSPFFTSSTSRPRCFISVAPPPAVSNLPPVVPMSLRLPCYVLFTSIRVSDRFNPTVPFGHVITLFVLTISCNYCPTETVATRWQRLLRRLPECISVQWWQHRQSLLHRSRSTTDVQLKNPDSIIARPRTTGDTDPPHPPL